MSCADFCFPPTARTAKAQATHCRFVGGKFCAADARLLELNRLIHIKNLQHIFTVKPHPWISAPEAQPSGLFRLSSDGGGSLPALLVFHQSMASLRHPVIWEFDGWSFPGPRGALRFLDPGILIARVLASLIGRASSADLLLQKAYRQRFLELFAHDPDWRNADFYMCGEPPYFCWLLASFRKPVVGYLSTPLSTYIREAHREKWRPWRTLNRPRGPTHLGSLDGTSQGGDWSGVCVAGAR